MGSIWDGTDLFLGSIRVPGIDHGENAGEDPWRSTHEKSGNVGKAKGTGKSRLLVERC